MAGIAYGSFAVGDANIDNVMLELAGLATGYNALSLTQMNTTAVPAIASGSKIEVGGTLFKFSAEEAITGSPSDGTVYIKLIPSGSSIIAQFTNTAPTWSDNKQGWYGTGSGAGHRYVNIKLGKLSSVWYKALTDRNFIVADKIAFSAYKQDGETTGAGALSYPVEILDTHNTYNNTTSKYTIPIAGYYQFFADISIINSSYVIINSFVRKNSVGEAQQAINYSGTLAFGTGNNQILSSSCLMPCAVGDTVYINGNVGYTYMGKGSGYAPSEFKGHLIY